MTPIQAMGFWLWRWVLGRMPRTVVRKEIPVLKPVKVVKGRVKVG